VEGVDPEQNDAQLHLMLDQPKEKRQHAQICITASQQHIRAAHHKNVKVQKFQVGDLILKRVTQTTRQKDQGKLGPNWESPYIIVTRGGKRSYTLVDQAGNQLKKQWNSFHLKRYYVKIM